MIKTEKYTYNVWITFSLRAGCVRAEVAVQGSALFVAIIQNKRKVRFCSTDNVRSHIDLLLFSVEAPSINDNTSLVWDAARASDGCDNKYFSGTTNSSRGVCVALPDGAIIAARAILPHTILLQARLVINSFLHYLRMRRRTGDWCSKNPHKKETKRNCDNKKLRTEQWPNRQQWLWPNGHVSDSQTVPTPTISTFVRSHTRATVTVKTT